MKNHNDLHKLYEFLKKGRASRKQIATHFNLPYNTSSDRFVRRLVAELATEVPIISNSKTRGYSIAKKEDMAEVERSYRELKKKIIKMEERMEVLGNFKLKSQW